MDESKIAIVTGAAGGLGHGITEALIGQGWTVAGFDIAIENLADLATRDGLHLYDVDVTSAESVEGAVGSVRARPGLARGTDQRRRDESHRTVDRDHRRAVGPAHRPESQRDLPLLPGGRAPDARRRRRAHVNMTSNMGMRPEAQQVGYASAKAGLVGLTRSLALELAPDQITVNAVAPVMTLTKRVAGLPVWWKDLQLSKIPLGRYGTIEDTVNTVMFLISEQGAFFTGQVLSPNGGDFMS